MPLDLTQYLRILYHIVLSICTIYAIFKAVKHGLKSQNSIVFYILIIFIIETAIFFGGPIIGSDIFILYNIGVPIFVFTLALFYQYEWKKKLNVQIHFIVTLITLILMLYYLTQENLFHFITPLGNILTAYYIFCALHWFYFQISYPDENSITNKLPFWVSASLLGWCVIIIFRLVLKDYLSETDPSFLSFLQYSINIVNIIVYLLITKGISCLR